MPLTAAPLDMLAFEFFQEFARCEYCLKMIGLLEPNRRDPTADWGAFAEGVRSVLDAPNDELAPAVAYYLGHPPKKQGIVNQFLDWVASTPDHKSQSELVLRLVCRVRNNLFHGGKFNGRWFEPQRSEELLRYGLQILRACVAAHAQVRAAYEGAASTS